MNKKIEDKNNGKLKKSESTKVEKITGKETTFKKKKKIYDYLFRKGYESSLIQETISKL